GGEGGGGGGGGGGGTGAEHAPHADEAEVAGRRQRDRTEVEHETVKERGGGPVKGDQHEQTGKRRPRAPPHPACVVSPPHFSLPAHFAAGTQCRCLRRSVGPSPARPREPLHK